MIDRRYVQQLVRDMTPYVGVLTSIARYFKAGEDITIFEVGVRRGASTKAFLSGLVNRVGTGRLYSCDIDDRNDRITDEKQKELWTFIHGHSQKIEWDKEIDILMLDGEHSEKAVREDYLRYEPCVSYGGLILLHDISFKTCQVRLFWDSNYIKYPKIALQLNKEGLGIINKV